MNRRSRAERRREELRLSDEENVKEIRRLAARLGYLPSAESEQRATLSEEASARIWARIVAERERLDALEAASSPVGRTRRLGGARVRWSRPRDPQAPRSPRRYVLAVAATAVLALVAAGVLQPWSTPSATASTPPLLTFSALNEGQTSTRGASAAGELLRSAALAASSAITPDSTHGYVVRTANWSLETDSQGADAKAAVIPYRTVTRIGADGSMDRMQRLGEALTTDGHGVLAGGDPIQQPTVQRDSFPPGYIDTTLMATLARDPATLRATLLQREGCPEGSDQAAGCLMRAITGFFNTQVVPGDLEAAFWRVLATEPGVEYLGTGHDRASRPCIGIAVRSSTTDNIRWVLILNPTTGDYLGQEQVLVAGSQDGVKAPAVLDFSVLLSTP